MLIKNVLVVVAVGVLTSSAVRAAEWSDRFKYEREAVDKFPPHELNLDLFGTYATKDRWGGRSYTAVNGPFNSAGNPVGKDDQFGGGVGLNYFFTRYVGIGADTYLEEWKWPYRVNGSLFLRYPMPAGVAPYAFGGGGREFKYLTQWTYHAGGGLEFRFNPFTGIFAEGRRVFSDKTSSLDYTLVRAAMRLSF